MQLYPDMAARVSQEEQTKELSVEKLSRPCQRQDLLEIAHSTPNWREIAFLLGFEESEQEDIVSAYPNCYYGQKCAFFTRWGKKAGLSATYLKLIQVFDKVGRRDLVEIVENMSKRGYESFDSPYISFLRMQYCTHSHDTLHWPPVPHCEYIKLTLHKEDEMPRRHVELSEHDQLLQSLPSKEPVGKTVELEDILTLSEAKRKLVVLEGVSGIGKSTLALNACQRWANHKLFKEYDYVILLELNNPALQSATSLADILPCRITDGCIRDSEMAQEAAAKLVAQYGAKTLFIIDGWEVFPPECKKNSLIQKLLFEPELLSMNMSTVLITSRPDSSADLHCIASSRVQIFGFKPVEVEEYFTKVLQDSVKVNKLVSHLYLKYPSLHSNCYIPLNAAIIVHVFVSLGETLPRTMHDAFCALVQSCIIQYVSKITPERKLKNLSPRHPSLVRHSLNQLPSDLTKQLNAIAYLACKAASEGKTMFTEEDLKSLGLATPFPTLGLLQPVESFTLYGKSVFYNFMHSSVQQFLTALCLSQLTPAEQVKRFQAAFDTKNYTNCVIACLFANFDIQAYIWTIYQFFAGFTELKQSELQESIMEVVHTYNSAQKVPLFLFRYNMAAMRSRPFLSLVCCLYEAQNESLCKLVASQLEAEINLTHVIMTAYECVSVGYLLCNFSCNDVVTVILSHTYINNHCIDLLCKEFLNCEDQKCKLKLFLVSNNISYEGIKSITQLLHTQHLVYLDFSFNSLSDKGADCIATALQSNTSLLVLRLNNCQITDDGVAALGNAISRNQTLQELNINDNPFTDTGLYLLTDGLQKNHGLRTLGIDPQVDLRMKTLLKVNPTLTKITSDALKLFVISVANHKQLTRLDVGEFGIQDEAVREALVLVNQQRKENGIQALELFCSVVTLARFP